MSIQAQHSIHEENVKQTEDQLKSSKLLKLLNQQILRKLFRHLNRTTPAQRSRVASESQKNLVLTGLILGFISIFAAFFPVCGLPIAITGLVLGTYGRRTTSLQMMSSWAYALSLTGLILAFLYTMITISIYLGNYLFGS
jgi:hypothetical protein